MELLLFSINLLAPMNISLRRLKSIILLFQNAF